MFANYELLAVQTILGVASTAFALWVSITHWNYYKLVERNESLKHYTESDRESLDFEDDALSDDEQQKFCRWKLFVRCAVSAQRKGKIQQARRFLRKIKGAECSCQNYAHILHK